MEEFLLSVFVLLHVPWKQKSKTRRFKNSKHVQECMRYWYGENCSNPCSFCPEPCYNVSGLCMDGCLPGLTGDRCDKECLTDNGSSYRGKLSTTINGYTCLPWIIVYTQPEQNWLPGFDHNFCRTKDTINPPHCFVDEGRGVIETDDCSIEECPGNDLTRKNESLCPKYFFGRVCQQECYQCKQTCNYVTGMCPDGCSPGWTGEKCDEETNCLLGEASSYRGTWHTTVDGEICEIWASKRMIWDQGPFVIKHNNNFCRSPNNANVIWCVFNDQTKACDIPKCSERTVTSTESTDEPSTEYVTSYYVADDWNGATIPLPTVCTCVTFIVNLMTVRVQIRE